MRMKFTALVSFGMVAFLAGCQTAAKKQAQAQEAQQLREEKIRMFEQVDVSGDGRIDIREFHRGYRNSGPKDITVWFVRFDADANGAITQKEWLEEAR